MIRNAVQHSENLRDSLVLNCKSAALLAGLRTQNDGKRVNDRIDSLPFGRRETCPVLSLLRGERSSTRNIMVGL